MISPKITAGLSVAFQTEVLSDGIVTSCKRSRNLVLDVGLDLFAAYGFGQLFSLIVLGTGTRPTRRDSGMLTASQTGNTVTASGNFFEAADVGRLLRFDSGAEVYVTGFTSATSVTVADAVTRDGDEFTVWYVNDTGHEAEHSRLGAYSAERGTFTAGVYTLTRTFTSNPFAAAAQIKEIGWSPTESGALFGRALVPGGGDFVGAGKQYRVTVSGSIHYGPAAAVAQPDVGNNGFSTAGEFALERCPFDGATNNFRAWLLNNGAAALTPLAGNDLSYNYAANYAPNGDAELARAEYVAGARKHTFTGTIAAADGVSDHIDGIGLVAAHSNPPCDIGRIRLAVPQSKDALHALTLGFVMSWGRVLIN